MNDNNVTAFGFNNESGSTLTKRTMMTNELFLLFESVQDVQSDQDTYREAVIEGNCLAKRTVKNRGYSFNYLKRLYGLTPEYITFRAFRYFFDRDEKSRELLCLLTAYSRDKIIQASSEYIHKLPFGSGISKTDFENHIDKAFPSRFSQKMLQSLIRNLLSSWKQSGHLSAVRNTERQQVSPGSGAISFALLLGFLNGVRGQTLFQTEYIKLLDCSFERSIELAEQASRKGWMVFNRIGGVIEVGFPNLINPQEMEWIREQN